MIRKKDYTTAIVLEKRTPTKDSMYPVKLRLTINRKTRYYSLDYYATEDEFKKLFSPKSKGEEQGELLTMKKQADDLLDNMDPPSFDRFKRLFTQKGEAGNVKKYYLEYVDECKRANRFGTASSYECSMNSLDSVRGIENIRFQDITPEWLNDYEIEMTRMGKSISTIGIYLRPLRFLYNRAIRDGIVKRGYYPFGDIDEGKYEIPTSENHKRPLDTGELETLAGYSGNKLYEYYRDFFLLSYYLVGLNFADLVTLQWKQLSGNSLTLIRQKTKRTRRTQKPIILKLNDDAMDIISRHGTRKGKYIFEIIQDNDTPEIIRQKVQNFIRNTNQALKRLAKQLKINPDISTVYARHSAASHGLKAGISLAMISKSLGHSNIAVTSNYISTIDDEEQILADALKINRNGS